MKIVVFGSQKCKFCNKQLGFLKKSFSEKDWLYLDVNTDKELYKIASDVRVKNIPTTVVFDSEWNPVFSQEGTTSNDLLFYHMYGGKNIPIGNKTASIIKEKGYGKVLLSKERNISPGDYVNLVDYSNNLIKNAKVMSIEKVSPKIMGSVCHQDMLREYYDLGGRKDWAQLIIF